MKNSAKPLFCPPDLCKTTDRGVRVRTLPSSSRADAKQKDKESPTLTAREKKPEGRKGQGEDELGDGILGHRADDFSHTLSGHAIQPFPG